MTGCGAVGVPAPAPDSGPDVATAAGQQSHLHGGQVTPSVHAGQPQPQPPLPVVPPLPPPPSDGGLIRTHWPVGHGVVKQAICS